MLASSELAVNIGVWQFGIFKIVLMTKHDSRTSKQEMTLLGKCNRPSRLQHMLVMKTTSSYSTSPNWNYAAMLAVNLE